MAKKVNMLLFVCSEAVESQLVKLETSRAIILSTTVSVLLPKLCKGLVVVVVALDKVGFRLLVGIGLRAYVPYQTRKVFKPVVME